MDSTAIILIIKRYSILRKATDLANCPKMCAYRDLLNMARA